MVTDRVYDRVAEYYDSVTSLAEWFISKHRKEILWLAKGLILEVGFGTGSSFKDYPPNSNVIAVDVSRGMLERAAIKLKSNEKCCFELVMADIGYLPFRDYAFDMIFSSLVMCSPADPIDKLKEIRRVTKNHGKLLMIEHVKSKNKLLGYWMEKANLLTAPFDNINRETVENVERAGWTVTQEKDIAYDIVEEITAENRG